MILTCGGIKVFLFPHEVIRGSGDVTLVAEPGWMNLQVCFRCGRLLGMLLGMVLSWMLNTGNTQVT